MPIRCIYDFSDKTDGDPADARDLLGGKGLSLRRMTAAGLSVPPGFTITTDACQFFFENSGEWPLGMDAELKDAVARLETASGCRFGDAHKPLLVSVRSGAAVSMPGMMDTILNCGLMPSMADHLGPSFWPVFLGFLTQFSQSVHGISDGALYGAAGLEPREARTREDGLKYLKAFEDICGAPFPDDVWAVLKACIDAVFRSWSSPRAVEYRKSKSGAAFGKGTAVNVQHMFPSSVSGVVFTRSPGNPDSEDMVIEASYGLGEALVSGEVDPDHFVVSRSDGSLKSSRQGSKASSLPALGTHLASAAGFTLGEEQLARLARLALDIEEFMGSPQDIEFGYDGREFGLLQCRPIRGMDEAAFVNRIRSEESGRLAERAASGQRIWAAHNLGETLPFPTPLTWDLVRYFMSGAGGMGELYRKLGYIYPDSEEAGFLELVCGRIYADPDRAVRLLWPGMPVSCDIERIVDDPAQAGSPPVTIDPDNADGLFLLRLPAQMLVAVRVARKTRKLSGDAITKFEGRVLSEYRSYLDSQRAVKLADMDIRGLVNLLRERRKAVMKDFACESLLPGYLGSVALADLESLLSRLLGDVGKGIARSLISGSNPVSARQKMMMSDVSADKLPLSSFLAEFGHRAANEMELAAPRWREEPEELKKSLSLRKIRHTEKARVESESPDLAEVGKLLAEEGMESLLGDVERKAILAHSLLKYREIGKHYLMMGYELIREVLLELDRRWGLEGRIFYMRWDEVMVGGEQAGSSAGQLDERRRRCDAVRRISTGAVIRAENVAALGASSESAPSALRGTPVSDGIATGTVCIATTPSETGQMPEECILVCPSTDPGWMPVLVRATGLIVERGGVLSHGALIARDLGIPAIVWPGATSSLLPGERIRIDGFKGTIEKLDGGEGA